MLFIKGNIYTGPGTVLGIDTMVNKMDFFLNVCEQISRRSQIMTNKDQTMEWWGVVMGWGPNLESIVREVFSWKGLCLCWDPTNEKEPNQWRVFKATCSSSDMKLKEFHIEGIEKTVAKCRHRLPWMGMRNICREMMWPGGPRGVAAEVTE